MTGCALDLTYVRQRDFKRTVEGPQLVGSPDVEDRLPTEMDKSTMLLLPCHADALIAIKARALRLYWVSVPLPRFQPRPLGRAREPFPTPIGSSRSSGTGSGHSSGSSAVCAS